MRLSVERLHVRASVPRRLRANAPDAARLARHVMPRAIARELEQRLHACPRICRIRRLRVRVRLAPGELEEARVAEAWAQAFCHALLTAIHQPPESGQSIAADSPEAWLTAVMCAVLDGARVSDWPYDEFAAYEGQSAGSTVLAIVRDRDAEWPAVLAALQDRGVLERLLDALGAAGCRDLVDQLAVRAGWTSLEAVNDVVRVAEAVVRLGTRFTSARTGPVDANVLRMIAMTRQSGEVAQRISPRALRAALATFEFLVNVSRAGAPFAPARLMAFAAGTDFSQAPALSALLQSFVDEARTTADEHRGQTNAVRLLIARMAQSTAPSPFEKASDIHDSAVAGLFLLVRVIEQLQWPERVRRTAIGATYGSRSVAYVLAGTALAVLGKTIAGCERLDRGVALFSGWFDNPDVAALARMTRHDIVEARKLVQALTVDSRSVDDVTTWDHAFAAIASYLVQRFACGLRGFARSSERFVVERLLALPGSIVIEERRMLVRLRSNAFWPVVHLSGADTSVEAVSWLAARRLELHLEGL